MGKESVLPYYHDFHYYYEENGSVVVVPSLSQVPEREDIEFCKLQDAIGFLQIASNLGIQQYPEEKRSPYHNFVLKVVRLGVMQYGQIFPVVYRGWCGDLPYEKHQVLFGALDRRVAERYGTVAEHSVFGLLTHSHLKSVVTDDLTEMDEEIIWFPDLQPQPTI